MEGNSVSALISPQSPPAGREEPAESRTKGHSRKKLELTGQRYGRLTVLAPAENIGSRTAWLCRCDCGRETVVKTNRLRSGHTLSCGCQGASRRSGAGLRGLTYVDGTCVEMLAAKTVRRNNTSGVPGVDWWASKQRWRAAICFKGKRHYLGSYARFEDAVKARRAAEEALHDQFLRDFARSASQEAACPAAPACGQELPPCQKRDGQSA